MPLDLLKETAKLGRLPVVNFAAGGLATPADVSMLMQLGVDGCFVGSGIFKSDCPEKRAHAMVQAVTHYNDPEMLAKVSEDLGTPMASRNVKHFKRGLKLHIFRLASIAINSERNGSIAKA